MSLLRGVAEAAKVAGVTAGSKPTALSAAAARNLKGMVEGLHYRIVNDPTGNLSALHEQFFRKFFDELKVRKGTVLSDLPNGNAGLMALMQVNLFA